MCGVIAQILAKLNDDGSVSGEIYEALGILQHRGQDAAGIGRLYQCKGNGLVREVFTQQHLQALRGYMGVGHVRYPTAGTSSNSEAQPFYVNSPYGIVLAHNGNLVNAESLRRFLDMDAHRHVNTDSDSELLLNIFAYHLQKTGKFRINEEDLFTALAGVYDQCLGAFACAGMLAGYGLFGFRDALGIRPLVYGSRETMTGTDWMIASESVALEALGFRNIVNFRPGEAIIFTRDSITRRQIVPSTSLTPCIFEYVYFARPDSIIDGVSVYRARLAMGEALAKKILQRFGENHGIDVIVPVPDTSRVAALEVSYKLEVPYREGFMKNRYIGRTFIMPGQAVRVKNVRRKLLPMKMEFAGKNVLIIDGTTSREIVAMARECGAKTVLFGSCAPPIRFPNFYGIDMPTRKELVAYDRCDSEVANAIGADYVIYQDLEDLVESVHQFNPDIRNFELSVFNGVYSAGEIDEDYITGAEIRKNRSVSDLLDTDAVGLHNFCVVRH